MREVRPALGGMVAGNTQEEQTRGRLVCPEWQTREYGFERARSYALYRAGLRRAIVLLKFERIEPLSSWFAKRLAEIVRREVLAADVVVPVPLHRSGSEATTRQTLSLGRWPAI